MSKRPEFTIAKITEQFEVSRSTVRRGLNDGRFPNAKKDPHGRWLIPIDDIIQAGFTPRKTWLNELAHNSGSEGAHDPTQLAQRSSDANEDAGFTNQAHLEKELAHERAQVEKLKALLDAERNHVESLRMALRMIESSKPSSSEKSAEQATPEQSPAQYKNHRDRKIPRLFQRFFPHP